MTRVITILKPRIKEDLSAVPVGWPVPRLPLPNEADEGHELVVIRLRGVDVRHAQAQVIDPHSRDRTTPTVRGRAPVFPLVSSASRSGFRRPSPAPVRHIPDRATGLYVV